MNLILSTSADVFQSVYSFTAWESGFTLFGLGIGFIIGQIVIGAVSDPWLKRQKSKHGESRPEDRLPPLMMGAVLIPAGYFWYGWSMQAHAHWIVPSVGSSLISIGTIFCFLPISLYLVDTYGKFAASATAGNLVARSIVSAVVPLAAQPLYGKVGYGWANSVFAFIGLAFLPTLVLLFRYGSMLRIRSKVEFDRRQTPRRINEPPV